MEIDASDDDLAVRLCPDHAVIVWTESDRIFCRFPDRHLVTFDSPQQLMVTLKHRERIRNHKEMTVGTDASPVQYDIDAVAAAFKNARGDAVSYEEAKKKGAETRERERARLLRKDAKMQKAKAAERELRELNLL
jgi:hypothetical protein